MHRSWLATVAVVAAAAVFMATSNSPQRPGPQRMNDAYADWLVPYVGKDFYVSADWQVATEKKRTTAVPVGAQVKNGRIAVRPTQAGRTRRLMSDLDHVSAT